MKVVIERVGGGPISFENFADNNNLVMKVCERSGNFVGTNMHYFAAFEYIEIVENGFLIGVRGDGQSPELAIANYQHKLRGKRLAYRASYTNRREIQCPTEWL